MPQKMELIIAEPKVQDGVKPDPAPPYPPSRAKISWSEDSFRLLKAEYRYSVCE